MNGPKRLTVLGFLYCAGLCAATAQDVVFREALLDFKSEIVGEQDYCAGRIGYRMLDRFFFDTAEGELDEAGEEHLQSLIDAVGVEGIKHYRLRVEGFSDSVGDPERNAVLAAARAESIRARLGEALPGVPISADRGANQDIERAEAEDPAPDRTRRRADILIARMIPVRLDTDARDEALAQMAEFSADKTDLGPMVRAFSPGLRLKKSGVIEFRVQPAARSSGTAASETAIALTLHGEDGRTLAFGIDQPTGRAVLWSLPDEEVEIFELPFILEPGTVHHVALNYDESRIEVWLDGVLAGRVERSLSGLSVSEMVFGGYDPLRNRLSGSFGALRFWDGPRDCPGLRTKARSTEAPELALTRYDPLYGMTEKNRRGALDMFRLADAFKPARGSFMHFGSDQIALQNPQVLQARQPPDLDISKDARMLRKLNDAHVGFAGTKLTSTHMDGLSYLDGPAEQIFSGYPMVVVEAHERPAEPGGDGGRTDVVQKVEVPYLRRVRQFRVRRATKAIAGRPDHIQSITLRTAPMLGNDRLEGAISLKSGLDRRQQAEATTVAFDLPCIVNGEAPFALNEAVKGISGTTRNGYLQTFNVHTNRRVLRGCATGRRSSPDPRAEAFELWVEPGESFHGIGVARNRKGNSEIRLLRPPQQGERRISITREDGVSEVFLRTGRNTYVSLLQRSLIAPSGCGRKATLVMLSDEHFKFDCSSIDFVAAVPKPDPQAGGDRFDNTFVRLSKAVNLQANYRSYDMAKMDPLHLVDTGTTKSVFQMPSANSRDFYDFNRIFVPDGLFYVPEFTGGNVTKTTYSRDSSQYKTHFSQTVGFSGGVEETGGNPNEAKDSAKFSASNTISRARSILNGAGHDMTISTSQIALYALVLNKAHMKLDRTFRKRLDYLRDFPDPRNFDDFVETYGTHYPHAVIYGGLGVLEMQYDTSQSGGSFSNEDSIAVNAQASLKGISGGFDFQQTKGVADDFSNEMGSQIDNFYWVGGAHAGATRESWGVGLDGVVPIYVDLRPLDEILLPPFVSDTTISYDVRYGLRDAIARYVQKKADEDALRERSFEDNRQNLFVVKLVSARVEHVGDELDGEFELAGQLTVASNDNGRLHRDSNGVFFNRPGPVGSETADTALRPSLAFEWDQNRIGTNFKRGFEGGITLGITELIRLVKDEKIRETDHTFSDALKLSGEDPEQFFLVRRSEANQWSVTVSSKLREDDDGAGSNDDALPVQAGQTSTFGVRDFPVSGGVAKRSITLRDNSCGDFGCTKLKLNFELRRILER